MPFLFLRISVFACVMSLTGAGRCAQGVDSLEVSRLFPSVNGLAALTGVYLGMNVGELRKVRTNAVPARYLGLQEIVGTDTVRYHVADPPLPQSAVEDAVFGARRLRDASLIEAIDQWNPVATAASASRLWRETSLGIGVRGSANLQCFLIHRRSGVTRFAVVALENAWYGVALIEEARIPTAPESYKIPAVVITFLTSRLEIYAPRVFSKEVTACP